LNDKRFLEVEKKSPIVFLQATALAVLLVGALISLGLVTHAGRNNHSVLLPVLFVVWVLSPFAALFLACLVSGSWKLINRLILYILTFILTVCSLTGYSGIFTPHGAKPAFIYLAVPLVSWLLMAIIFLLNILLSHKSKGT
jgi:hypothetical protein